MKVYSISVNSNEFRSLEFTEDYDAAHRLPVMSEKGPIDWHPPMTRFRSNEKPVADFIALGADIIVFDPASLDVDPDGVVCEEDDNLTVLVEMACFGAQAFVETDTGLKLGVLMVTESCNALDRKRSVWSQSDQGEPETIDQFAFHEGRIGTNSGLFRLADPVLDAQYIFAYTRGVSDSDEGYNFYYRYHSSRKTGLTFNEVWSS